jgi:hypothetical protein
VQLLQVSQKQHSNAITQAAFGLYSILSSFNSKAVASNYLHLLLECFNGTDFIQSQISGRRGQNT